MLTLTIIISNVIVLFFINADTPSLIIVGIPIVLGSVGVLFLPIFNRVFPSSLQDFHLLAQLYRRHAVKGVLDRKGPKAHAALVCLIARGLPPGAVELAGETLLSAVESLGYTADEVLPLTQRANLR